MDPMLRVSIAYIIGVFGGIISVYVILAVFKTSFPVAELSGMGIGLIPFAVVLYLNWRDSKDE
jgi:hypothetical protein